MNSLFKRKGEKKKNFCNACSRAHVHNIVRTNLQWQQGIVSLCTANCHRCMRGFVMAHRSLEHLGA
jgi:hypothetical protein